MAAENGKSGGSAERGAEMPDTHSTKVVSFPRANLRRIWQDWAEDQVAIGKARRRVEPSSPDRDRD